MIHDTRIQPLNEQPASKDGAYVLYWMQASQRARSNHALEYAIQQANSLSLPVCVCFGLMDDYPAANARSYAFMLQGLRDVEANLKQRGIQFVMRHGQPWEVARHAAREAALVVCDRGYLRHQKQWREHLADKSKVPVVQVESDVVVPADEVSEKQEFAARTIRPKINKLRSEYLQPLPAGKVKHDSLQVKLPVDAQHPDLDPSDPVALLGRLKVDRSVTPSLRLTGGENAAEKMLVSFVRNKLARYDEDRNEPSAAGTSMMAAYLHFGNISPLQIALAVMNAKDTPASHRDSYLEELIVRRELAVNYVLHQPDYDRYEALPEWARKTLSEHRLDARDPVYSRAELEAGKTYDRWWNAAQMEMVKTGYMHNYMRMYWGKKVLEWKGSPQEAFEDLIYLNDKYFLCGRDPNGYTNVAWIFGLHDRPWGERKIFGKVRYMNAGGLERKFDMDAYVKRVEALCDAESDDASMDRRSRGS